MTTSRLAARLANQLGMESSDSTDTPATSEETVTATVAAPDAVVTQVPEYDTDDEGAVEAAIDQHIDALEEVTTVTAAYDELDQVLDKTETVDRVGLEMIQNTIRFLDSRLGIESTGLESITVSTEGEGIQNAKAAIAKRLEQVKQFFIKLYNKFKEFATRFFSMVRSRLTGLKKKVEVVEAAAKEKEKTSTPFGYVVLSDAEYERLYVPSHENEILGWALGRLKDKSVSEIDFDELLLGKGFTVINKLIESDEVFEDNRNKPIHDLYPLGLKWNDTAEEYQTQLYPGNVYFSIKTSEKGDVVQDMDAAIKFYQSWNPVRHQEPVNKPSQSAMAIKLTTKQVKDLSEIISYLEKSIKSLERDVVFFEKNDWVRWYNVNRLKKDRNIASASRFVMAYGAVRVKASNFNLMRLRESLSIASTLLNVSTRAMAENAPVTEEEAKQKAEAT